MSKLERWCQFRSYDDHVIRDEYIDAYMQETVHAASAARENCNEGH
jgi:hypothetical protein